MTFKQRYTRRVLELLNDNSICQENRDLFKEFFEYEEVKLKRQNNLRALDEKSYKTLNLFIYYFRTANKWFKNKDWKKLTKQDIEKIYNDLEDGVIKKANGKPFEDRVSFYNKVFKSKPFQIAGRKEIAQEVIQYVKSNGDNEVRFIEFEDFKKLVLVAIKPNHKLLLWLLWDIGENISAILELQKKNCVKKINKDTKENEYIINLPQDKIKRSRTTRSVLTNFKETTELLDLILQDLKEEDYLFEFGYRQAEKIFDRAVKITKIKCKPNGERPTPKDLRSSMTCYLLEQGWSLDEVRARLGHKPSSSAIDKYANYKAISSSKPKVKIYQNNLEQIEEELESVKHQDKIKDMRIEQHKEQIKKLCEGFEFLLDFIPTKTKLSEKDKKAYLSLRRLKTI